MRQARLIRYLVVAAFLLLLAACANFPAMRSSMPPTPAEPPPGAAAPPGSVPTPAPDPTQQMPTLETRVQQLESRLAELESRKGAPAPAKERTVPAPAPPSSPKPAVSGAAGDKPYNDGMRLYQAKKYGEARLQFHQYLKNPRGPRAAEARYYLADSFYLEGKYREAAVEFNKLRLQFPTSVLAPAGLLRQALCYKNLQQTSTYRTTLQKLVKAYPNSPEAKEAQKLLKEGHKESKTSKGAAR
jgi:tol-pal system protein YbgF